MFAITILISIQVGHAFREQADSIYNWKAKNDILMLIFCTYVCYINNDAQGIKFSTTLKEVLHIICFIIAFRRIHFPDDILLAQFGIKIVLDFSSGLVFNPIM